MAQPLAFPEANFILYPPNSLKDDVLPLHLCRGQASLVSCWKLSAEELSEILRTGVVWIGIMGRVMPPLMVSGCRQDVLG